MNHLLHTNTVFACAIYYTDLFLSFPFNCTFTLVNFLVKFLILGTGEHEIKKHVQKIYNTRV